MSGYNYSNYNRIPFSGTYGGYTPNISADQNRVNAALTNYNSQWTQLAQSNSFSTSPGLKEAQAELNAANAQLQADRTNEYAMARTIGSSFVQSAPIGSFQERNWNNVSNSLDAFTYQQPSYSYPASYSIPAPNAVPSPYTYDSSNVSTPYSAPGSQSAMQSQSTRTENSSNYSNRGENTVYNSSNFVGSGNNNYGSSNQGYPVNATSYDSNGSGTMRADSAVDRKVI